jgi:hypothetical protein
MRFGEKTACPDMPTFSKETKKQIWAFGTGLEPFGHSKYLVIWAFGQKRVLIYEQQFHTRFV